MRNIKSMIFILMFCWNDDLLEFGMSWSKTKFCNAFIADDFLVRALVRKRCLYRATCGDRITFDSLMACFRFWDYTGLYEFEKSVSKWASLKFLKTKYQYSWFVALHWHFSHHWHFVELQWTRILKCYIL